MMLRNWLAGALLGLFWLGFALRGPAANPDLPFLPSQLLGAFLISIAFLGCVLSWGYWIQRRLGLCNWGFAIAIDLGLLGASLGGLIFGTLGFAGFSWWPLWMLVALLGPFIRGAPKLKKPNYSGLEVFIILIGAIFFVSRLVMATVLQPNEDALMYHLTAPRLWAEAGQISLNGWGSDLYPAAYFEYVYLWGVVLLGGPKGRGLIECHFFAQWLQTFGLFFVWVNLVQLLRPLLELRASRWLAALFGVSSAAFLGVSYVAKNDLGICAWLLGAAAILLTSGARSRTEVCTAGMLAGAAFLAKPIYGFGALALAVVYGLNELRAMGMFQAVRSTVLFGSASLLSMAPVLIRNAIYSGNPLLPFLDQIFQSSVLTAYDRSLLYISAPHLNSSWLVWERRINEFLSDSLLNLGILFAPLYSRNRFVLWSVCGCSLFALNSTKISFPRWTGPSLLAFNACAAATTLVATIAIGRKFGRDISAAALFVFAALFGIAQLESVTSQWQTFLASSRPDLTIRAKDFQLGAEAKHWLRLHANTTDLVLSSGDNQIYYLSPLKVLVVTNQAAIYEKLSHDQTEESLVRELKAIGARYILNTRGHWNFFRWKFAAQLQKLLNRNPAAISFQGPDAQVIDVALL